MRRVLLVLVLIILLTVAMPSADADDGINVIPAQSPYEKMVSPGEQTSFMFGIYNGLNESVFVTPRVTYPLDQGIDDVIMSDMLVIGPGGTGIVNMTLVTNYYSVSRDLIVTLHLNCTGAVSGEMLENTTSVRLIIDSQFGPGANQNKIFGIWDNSLPSPFDGNWGAYLVTILGWLGIAALVVYAIEPLVVRVTTRFRLALIGSWVARTRATMVTAILVTGFFNSTRILDIDQRLYASIILIGDIILILLISWMVYCLYDELLNWYFARGQREKDRDRVAHSLVLNMGKIMISVVVVAALFNELGYNLTGFWATAGLAGLVIGLAMQDTLSNFFSGLYLMIGRPFKIGDLVETPDGVFCEVMNIGFRNTTLYNITDAEFFIIPNNQMANNKVVNMHKPDPNVKICVTVGVTYGSDVAEVRACLLEAASEHSKVLHGQDMDPFVRFAQFGESSLNFELWVWIDDIPDRWDIMSDLRLRIDELFRANDIEIAFPQRTVWFNQDPRRIDA